MKFIFLILILSSSLFTHAQINYSDFEWEERESLEFDNQFGSAFFSIEENPNKSQNNNSNYVLRLVKKGNKIVSWAGVSVDLKRKLKISESAKIRFQIYSASDLGVIKLKLENKVARTKGQAFEVDQVYNDTGKWVQLEYDISLATDKYFNRLVLFFDFGNTDPSEFFIDNLIIE